MQERKLTIEDVSKALSILAQTDIGKNILKNCQGINFDVSEITLIFPDGKRGARCFRQIDEQGKKDIVSINKDILNNEPFREINTQDEKYQMLANVLAHELTHAVQYGNNPDLIPIEDNAQRGKTEIKNQDNHIDEAVMESLIEADCRSVQFMMAIQSQSPIILKALEKQHIPAGEIPILNKNSYDIWKLKYKSGNKMDIKKKQQAFREIFNNILTSYVDVYEKYVFPKHNIESKIDFNGYEKLLTGIYDEQKYGSPRQFADIIPNLKDENKTKLVSAILSRKKLLCCPHYINITSSEKAENISATYIKSSRVLE